MSEHSIDEKDPKPEESGRIDVELLSEKPARTCTIQVFPAFPTWEHLEPHFQKQVGEATAERQIEYLIALVRTNNEKYRKVTEQIAAENAELKKFQKHLISEQVRVKREAREFFERLP